MDSQNSGRSEELEKLQAQVTELKVKIEANADGNKQSFAALEERIKLKDEFTKFREEVHGKFLFLQWSAAAVIVVAGFLGRFGLKSVSDYTKAIQTGVTNRLDHIESYYYELTRGVALLNAGEPAESLPHFRICFDAPDAHYDEGLLIPFLQALDNADDWEQSAEVLRTLRDEPKKYDAMKSPWVWSNVSVLQIQMGIQDRQSLDEGRKSLRRFELQADLNDPEMLRALYFQHWMLALADHDPVTAKKYIDKIALLPASVKIDSWDKIKGWRFTRALVNRNVFSEKALQDMIMPLKGRFKPD